MEAICSSEKSADFQRTTRRYIPQDSTLYFKKISMWRIFKKEKQNHETQTMGSEADKHP
jgi:hypothetical protein